MGKSCLIARTPVSVGSCMSQTSAANNHMTTPGARLRRLENAADGISGRREEQRADRQVLVNQRPVDAVAGRRKHRPISFYQGSAGEPVGTFLPRNRHGPAFHKE